MNESVKYENAVRRLTVDDIIARERACGVFGPFSQQRWLARAPQHIKDHLSRARKFPGVYGASQGFGTMVGNPVYPPSSFTPITASATETNFWTPAIWTPIPANDMTAGKGYHVKCGGIFTSTGTQGLLTFTPRCGQSSTPSSNITLGASNVTAPPASLTSQAWYAEFTMTIRALGLAASGATGTGILFIAFCVSLG